MILDRLDNADRYVALNPALAAAFAFLRRAGVDRLPLGRQEIDGDRVYAIVAKDKGRRRDEAKLEAHRRYIDIQFVVTGTDEMGWKDLASCREPPVPYDAKKDFVLLEDRPDSWVAVGPGTFAVFFPEDAHAPLVGTGVIHKVIVKVAVSNR